MFSRERALMVDTSRVEVLTELLPAEMETFWQIYRQTFEPVALTSPCRQSMSRAEFMLDMNDPTVFKFVIRGDDGIPEAMLIIASNFDNLSWLEPKFFEAKFPEEFASGRIFYVIALLVRSDLQGRVTHARTLMYALSYFLSERKAVLGADFSNYREEHGQSALIQRVLNATAEHETIIMGHQRYWAYRIGSRLEGS